MYENPIYDRYSDNGEYKYEVYKNKNGLYQICVMFREYDEYEGKEWFQYSDLSDIAHFTDTLERAIEIGDEKLRELA